jgi:acetate kinase
MFHAGPGEIKTLLSGSIDAIGEPSGSFTVHDGNGVLQCRDAGATSDLDKAFARMSGFLDRSGSPPPQLIGHRIVHGGPNLLRHCRIDDAVVAKLEGAAQFAPLHVPNALAGIRHATARFPDVPQVACFDTAFHADLPDVARVLPVARELEAQGLRRYGFHGLSCESILHQIGATLPALIIVAHLGSGASVTAVRNGMSVDTSMGLTPAGGVMMAMRSGDLDPGALVYLLREKKLDAGQLEQEIDRRAGLLAVSGLSGDMRVLRKAAGTNADARLAIAMFCHSVRKEIAAMGAVLGGIDMLVFTGGIGENDPQTRLEICTGLDWVGLALDEARNLRSENPIGANEGSTRVLVIPSREEEQIARNSWRVVQG